MEEGEISSEQKHQEGWVVVCHPLRPEDTERDAVTLPQAGNPASTTRHTEPQIAHILATYHI